MVDSGGARTTTSQSVPNKLGFLIGFRVFSYVLGGNDIKCNQNSGEENYALQKMDASILRLVNFLSYFFFGLVIYFHGLGSVGYDRYCNRAHKANIQSSYTALVDIRAITRKYLLNDER